MTRTKGEDERHRYLVTQGRRCGKSSLLAGETMEVLAKEMLIAAGIDTRDSPLIGVTTADRLTVDTMIQARDKMMEDDRTSSERVDAMLSTISSKYLPELGSLSYLPALRDYTIINKNIVKGMTNTRLEELRLQVKNEIAKRAREKSNE